MDVIDIPEDSSEGCKRAARQCPSLDWEKNHISFSEQTGIGPVSQSIQI